MKIVVIIDISDILEGITTTLGAVNLLSKIKSDKFKINLV